MWRLRTLKYIPIFNEPHLREIFKPVSSDRGYKLYSSHILLSIDREKVSSEALARLLLEHGLRSRVSFRPMCRSFAEAAQPLISVAPFPTGQPFGRFKVTYHLLNRRSILGIKNANNCPFFFLFLCLLRFLFRSNQQPATFSFVYMIFCRNDTCFSPNIACSQTTTKKNENLKVC